MTGMMDEIPANRKMFWLQFNNPRTFNNNSPGFEIYVVGNSIFDIFLSWNLKSIQIKTDSCKIKDTFVTNIIDL